MTSTMHELYTSLLKNEEALRNNSLSVRAERELINTQYTILESISIQANVNIERLSYKSQQLKIKELWQLNQASQQATI